MIKILFVLDSLPRRGKERRVVELLKGFNKFNNYKFEVIILSEKIQFNSIYNLSNSQVHIIKRKFRKSPIPIFKIHRIYNLFKPDIIQVWGSMAAIFSLPTAILRGCKFVNSSIGNATPNVRKFNIDKIITNITSPFTNSFVSNSYAGLSAYKISKKKRCLIRNGFDMNRTTNLIKKNELYKIYNITTNYVIGMLGVLNNKKDFKTLILTVLEILKTRKDITCLIVGDGENEEELKAIIPEKYKKYFIFMGLIDNVDSIINIFDIGILLTNTEIHAEGIPNVVMEYMAHGKPVIANNSGGIQELIMNKSTGLIVNNKDNEDLHKKIVFLIDHIRIAKEMGEKGKQRIKADFSLDTMILKFKNLYDQLVKI